MPKRSKGRPHLVALLLADRVYVDKSGKHIIAGTFNQIFASKVPAVHVGPALYLNLSDFSGDHSVSFRLVRLSDGGEVARSPGFPIAQSDRLKHAEITIHLPPLKFDQYGKYAVEVDWDGQYLGRCRIDIVPREEFTNEP